MDLMLSVANASFTYSTSEKSIFRNISFSLQKGESLCILGPNGIGKTTLLKCIAGLEFLAGGTVSLGDRDISRINRRDIAKILAYVPQFHQPVFAYSVFDIVLMGRSPHIGFMATPSDRDKSIAAESLAAIGIEHLASKAYTEISGGERQMVLFARVMAQQPKILLLDEPTAHLDFGNQIQVLTLIKQMSETGLVVVMTSHAPDHAFLAAGEVALMTDEGVRVGPPDKILTEERLLAVYGVDIRIMGNGQGEKPAFP
jgi:iron complex transport system ATP-binding protein